MGYLNETWMGYDAQLVRAKSPDGKRECMRLAFYLGVQTMLEAMRQAPEMDNEEFIAFMKGVTDEYREFQIDCAAEALAIINRIFGAKDKGASDD